MNYTYQKISLQIKKVAVLRNTIKGRTQDADTDARAAAVRRYLKTRCLLKMRVKTKRAIQLRQTVSCGSRQKTMVKTRQNQELICELICEMNTKKDRNKGTRGTVADTQTWTHKGRKAKKTLINNHRGGKNKKSRKSQAKTLHKSQTLRFTTGNNKPTRFIKDGKVSLHFVWILSANYSPHLAQHMFTKQTWPPPWQK